MHIKEHNKFFCIILLDTFLFGAFFEISKKKKIIIDDRRDTQLLKKIIFCPEKLIIKIKKQKTNQ